MDLKYHLLSCIILSLILFPFYSYYSLLIFIFGFFIDVDHYLYDIIKTKNPSLINSYRMHINKNKILKDQLHIFHTIEFIILFILLTIISNNFYLILISMGLVLHLILDAIYYIYITKKNIELKQTRAFSLISWIKRN
ncbi:MAG: hypothetical protein AABW57_01780 [Nanoarchaeota archaeon]